MVMGSRALTYGDANITEQKSDFLVHRTDYTDFFDLHASPLLHEILAGLQSPFSEAGSGAPVRRWHSSSGTRRVMGRLRVFDMESRLDLKPMHHEQRDRARQGDHSCCQP